MSLEMLADASDEEIYRKICARTHPLDHYCFHPMFLLDLSSYALGSICTGVVIDGNTASFLSEFQRNKFAKTPGVCMGQPRLTPNKTKDIISSMCSRLRESYTLSNRQSQASRVDNGKNYLDPPVTRTFLPCSA
jgi:hypothetical protein